MIGHPRKPTPRTAAPSPSPRSSAAERLDHEREKVAKLKARLAAEEARSSRLAAALAALQAEAAAAPSAAAAPPPSVTEPPGEIAPDSASSRFNRAIALWKSDDRAASVALLDRVADGQFGELDEVLAERVARKLLNYSARISWPETEAAARRTIERLPASGLGYRYLGEALLQQGQADAAKSPLERAVELDPEDKDARLLLGVLDRGGRGGQRPTERLRAWPLRQHKFDDPQQLIERYVLNGYPDRPLVGRKTVITTLGSCFAENLALRLGAAGYRVHSETIGEEVNSTYANRYLLDWIEKGPTDVPTRAIDEVYGAERRERLSAALKSSQVLILTLGVAPCFFEIETGDFAFISLGSEAVRAELRQRCRMRTTTVEENAANIEAILDTAERIAGHELQVVITVSPVPLAGTLEHYSAVLADCLSKSTLRLACEDVLQRRPGTIYWPSFEIVRWLGAHYSPRVPPVFGADDGNTRHVSFWLIDLIVESFVAHHSLGKHKGRRLAQRTEPQASSSMSQ